MDMKTECIAISEEVPPLLRKLDDAEKTRAALVAAELSYDFGAPLNEYIGVMNDENFWEWREHIRLKYGATKLVQLSKLGLNLSTERAHYLHVALGDNTKIAFTENAAKGKKDVQLRMSPGKYLKRFYPDLTDEQIRDAVTEFTGFYGPGETLHVAKTEAEIIRVIQKGPSESCMATVSYKGHVHPAAVYVSPDIEVLYIERKGRIAARVIANKSTKECARIYGDQGRMLTALQREGYRQKHGALIGCRLSKIGDDNGYGHIMAYVDAGTRSGGGALHFKASEDSAYWILVDDGDGKDTYCGYECCGTTGYSEEAGSSCAECGDNFDEDDLYFINDDVGSVCDNCKDEYFVEGIVNSNGREDYMRKGNSIYVECEDRYYKDTLDLNDFDLRYADARSEWIAEDDAVTDIDDTTQHVDDCTPFGETDGRPIYILNQEVSTYAGNLYRIDGNFVHDTSDEYLEAEDDVEIVSVLTLADAELPKYRMHIQEDLLRMDGNSSYLTTYAAADDLVVHRMNTLLSIALRSDISYSLRKLQRSLMIDKSEWRTWYKAFDISLPEPKYVSAAKPAATAKAGTEWKEYYRRAQDAGVRFEFCSSSGKWDGTIDIWSFSATQDRYRLADNFDGYDWCEALRKAQSAGIKFATALLGEYVEHFHFDESLSYYAVYVPKREQSTPNPFIFYPTNCWPASQTMISVHTI